METLIQKVLSKSNVSIADITGDNPVLLLDKNGFILDCAARESDSEGIRDLFKGLISGKPDIRDVFSLPEKLGLDSISTHQPSRFFPLRKSHHEASEGLETYYTLISLAWLQVRPGDGEHYIGLVKLPGVLPNIIERFTGGIVYIDRDNRLVLFNQGFYLHFKEIAASPLELLGRNADEFFEPSPRSLQRSALKAMRKPSPKEYQPLEDHDFRNPGVSHTGLLLPSSGTKRGGRGLEWNSRAPAGSFLSLLPSFDFADDLRIVFSGSFSAQDLPCIILGELKETALLRDATGYLVGPNQAGAAILVKKAGFVISASPVQDAFIRGENSVEFVKCGNAFHYSINGEKVLEFYDHDPLDRRRTWMTLYLREGRSCTLARLAAWVRKREAPPAGQPLFVNLKNGSENAFLLNRLFSSFLATTEGAYEAYRLQDVSDFQVRVKALENKYRKTLEEERRLSRLVSRYRQETGEFIGSGKAVERLREAALRIAPATATVFIQGETGTGKEVLAHFIHRNSGFRNGPFVKVDCATIAPTLMESVLFGHEKGAFTGAIQSTKGLFEQARDGTLFLDEVNNLAPDTQAKLLRFLNDQTIMPLGGQSPVQVDLRVMAASNRPLLPMVHKGLFREDLYYRLAVAELEAPPLRDRLEDLPELCEFFLQRFNQANHLAIKGFSPKALMKLHSHAWPGNVRELRNAVERAVLFCQGDTITDDLIELREAAGKKGRAKGSGRRPADFTVEELKDSARRHAGVLQRVTEEFGISRRALYYQLAKFGLDPNSFRKNPRQRRSVL